MKCTAPTVPFWAENIEVEQAGPTTLIVRGTGRSRYLVIPATSQVSIQAGSGDPKRAVHLQFADLCTDDQLLDFVRTNGPVWGRVRGKTRGKDQAENITVRQDLPQLKREQQLFHAAIQLLIALRDPSQSAVRIRTLISTIRELYPTETTSDKRAKYRAALSAMALALASIPPLGAPRRTNEAGKQQKMRSAAVRYHAVSAGHGTLCDLFNRFPPKLFPCSNGAIELPSYDPEGILPMLYFLLRRDYRDERHLIKSCAICGTTFKPERGDSDFCGRVCYKKHNDRDRYLRKKDHKTANTDNGART